ncbi:hypothetical protein ES708_12100 [subsurface metagenome]
MFIPSISPNKSPSSHFRHFLFLKPDALLVWDQVESTFPLEWNMWIPVSNTWTEEKTLHLLTPQNVDLEVHFAGNSSIEYTREAIPEVLVWDWPLLMQAEHGAGSITFTSLDLFCKPDSSSFSADLLRNILSDREDDSSIIGLISGNRKAEDALRRLGIQFETLTPSTIENANLSQYGMLVIGDFGNSTHDRIVHEYGWKINEYIEQGGKAVLVCRSPLKWQSIESNGEGFPPVPVSMSGCSVSLGDENVKTTFSDNPLWNTPVQITPGSWNNWIAGSIPGDFEAAEERLAFIPSTWSESWRVLSSANTSLQLQPGWNQAFGKPSRIRVKQPASQDFFTLFLPRRVGEPYLFDIQAEEPGFFKFADPATTWEIHTGGTAWTDANLSVSITRDAGTDLYAFDCTYIAFDTVEIRSAFPMSIYYSNLEKQGKIMTDVTNVISYSKGEMKVHAGEISFGDLFGDIDGINIERKTYVTSLTVENIDGVPVKGAKVYVEGRFTGVTDKNGGIPVRWNRTPPEVRIRYRSAESYAILAPGNMNVVIVTQ